MNFFNKKFLAIILALTIPLATQAHWLGDTINIVLKKKKTLAASAALGLVFSITASKFIDKMELNIVRTNQQHKEELDRNKKKNKTYAIFCALCIAANVIL